MDRTPQLVWPPPVNLPEPQEFVGITAEEVVHEIQHRVAAAWADARQRVREAPPPMPVGVPYWIESCDATDPEAISDDHEDLWDLLPDPYSTSLRAVEGRDG